MKVLLAVDDSSYSAQVADSVTARPWPLGSTARVLSVFHITLSFPQVWDAPINSIVLARQELMKRAEELTAEVAETLGVTSLGVETAVREGDPRTTIVDEASEWGADLIVVGSRGYTGGKGWLLGSVARYIIDHADCSVEVVRQKRAGRALIQTLRAACHRHDER